MRRFLVIDPVLMRRACVGSLFACALSVAPAGVLAQDVSAADLPAATTQKDADRIAKMRDLSAVQGASASNTSIDPAGGQAPADAGVAGGGAEDLQSLPANESLPLGVGGGLFGGEREAAGRPGDAGDGWLLSTLAALGVVIALVFVIRWVLRRGGVVASAAPKGSVVEVLSRTTVAPRSHVLLLRVGPRVLVVSDSQAGMRTLSEVVDPEEVAGLLGAVDAAGAASLSGSFSGAMKKLSGQWSEADEAQAQAADAVQDGVRFTQTAGAVSSVRGRLAALSRAGGGG